MSESGPRQAFTPPAFFAVYFGLTYQYLALDLRTGPWGGPIAERVDVLSVPDIYRELHFPLDPEKVIRAMVRWACRDRPEPDTVGTQLWPGSAHEFAQSPFWDTARYYLRQHWNEAFLRRCEAVLAEIGALEENLREIQNKVLRMELRGQINLMRVLWKAPTN